MRGLPTHWSSRSIIHFLHICQEIFIATSEHIYYKSVVCTQCRDAWQHNVRVNPKKKKKEKKKRKKERKWKKNGKEKERKKERKKEEYGHAC